jgi:hypothetical protein
MSVQLADATLMVNNEVWAIVPNTLVFTEGQGEQQIKAASVGGGKVEQVFSNDLETAFSMVKVDLHTTTENIQYSKLAKANGNRNVVQIFGQTQDGKLTRTFTQASIVGDPEKALGTDGTISLEFKANPAI